MMSHTFKELNDPNSDIYKENLSILKTFIEEKLPKCDMQVLHNHAKISGTVDEIAKACSHSAIKLVQVFFGTCRLHGHKDRTCTICGESGFKVLEKAHCNCGGCERPSLLAKAIQKIYVDEDTPIDTSEIYRNFIILHGESPIYLACAGCHKQYDSLPRKAASLPKKEKTDSLPKPTKQDRQNNANNLKKALMDKIVVVNKKEKLKDAGEDADDDEYKEAEPVSVRKTKVVQAVAKRTHPMSTRSNRNVTNSLRKYAPDF